MKGFVLMLGLGSLGILAPACSHDFSVFEPTAEGDGGITPGDGSAAGADAMGGGDAARDGGAGRDGGGSDATGGRDGPCTPEPTCLSRAKSCARDCRNGPRPQLQHCLQQCVVECSTCTQNAGCAAPSACDDTVNP